MIKIYRAHDIRDALRTMQAEMGPQAAVISERRMPTVRWWPFAPKMWEVVASDQLTAPAQTAPDANQHALETQLAEMRGTMERLMRANNLARLPEVSTILADVYDALLASGLALDLAQQVVLAARDELSGAAQNDLLLVRSAVRRQVEAAVNCRPQQVIRGTGPLTVFLLGQAGVGKTTTLTKMAAKQSLIEGRRVAVINADTERMGSQPQIEALSRVLDIEVNALTGSASELELALARHADKDVVFVDVPGYSQRDRSSLKRLEELVAVAGRKQCFLVLTASTALDEMHQTLRAFRPIGVHGIVLTKLDEAEYYGTAVTFATQSKIPIAYVTTGRRMPEDIELATPGRLGSLLFGDVAGNYGTPVKRSRKASVRRTPSTEAIPITSSGAPEHEEAQA
jgi:flagellar biosynthesis GTPase FlhF